MESIDPGAGDKLSNLTTALVSIERGEGSEVDLNKVECARRTLIDAVKQFQKSRFLLGRALAEYQEVYKQDQVWLLARKEIAATLGCNPRTVSRIIEESKAAAALSPFVLRALDDSDIDPGKKKHTALIEELLKLPAPESPQQAHAVVQAAVVQHASASKRAAKPAPESIERFAQMIAKLFRERFQSLPQSKRISELEHCLDMVLSALQPDVGILRSHDFPKQLSQPQSLDRKDTAAA
jgi:hypothetical protein